MKRVSICIVALSLACAGRSAPREFLPTPEEAQADPFGGWIVLTVTGDEQRTEGELLAVNAEFVWVLTADSAAVLPTALVKSGKLTAYHSPSAAGWTGLGVLSTLSNGVVLILTAPLWVITGSLASGSDVRASQRESPEPLRWEQLAMFARFPQGLPPGIDLRALKPKLPSTDSR